jgi:hypothetical protein
MIRLQGIEQHPRYRDDRNIVAQFNPYFSDPFLRYIIMLAIEGPYKFRNPEKIVEQAIEEAVLLKNKKVKNEALSHLKEILIAFVSSEHYMNNVRGTLLEQLIRYAGPEECTYVYEPDKHSLQEVKVYHEESSYHNGDSLQNLDIAFFHKGNRIRMNCYEVETFQAYEVKCNVNTFAAHSLELIKRGKTAKESSSYRKLQYVKEMSSHFKGMASIAICSLHDPRQYVKQLLKEQEFDCIHIWNPLDDNG